MAHKIISPLRQICALGRDGAAAIEFAIIGPIFLLMLLLIAELSIYFGTTAVIDYAVQNGARVVRVGYVDGHRTTIADFEDALCSVVVLLDCSGVSYSVEAQPLLTSATWEPTLDASGDIAGAQFQLGDPGDVVIITAAASHQFFTPFAAALFAPEGKNSISIIAHIIIKNEPFPT